MCWILDDSVRPRRDQCIETDFDGDGRGISLTDELPWESFPVKRVKRQYGRTELLPS